MLEDGIGVVGKLTWLLDGMLIQRDEHVIDLFVLLMWATAELGTQGH